MTKKQLESKCSDIAKMIQTIKQQPAKQMMASLNCPTEHQDSAACCVDCACRNLEIAHDLFQHAADCCP